MTDRRGRLTLSVVVRQIRAKLNPQAKPSSKLSYPFGLSAAVLSVVTGAAASMAISRPAYGQLPLAPATPSPAPIQPPELVTPELPGLREFGRYQPETDTIHLLLKLSQRKVHIYQGDKLIASYPVAIGRPEFPTPTGEFEVNQMIVNPSWQSPWTGEVEAPGADGSLGLRWIGFTEVKGGVIGFHGTPNVNSIGRAASHGCVRMRNEDIVKMYELVRIGTLVRVEP